MLMLALSSVGPVYSLAGIAVDSKLVDVHCFRRENLYKFNFKSLLVSKAPQALMKAKKGVKVISNE